MEESISRLRRWHEPGRGFAQPEVRTPSPMHTVLRLEPALSRGTASDNLNLPVNRTAVLAAAKP